MRKFIVTFLPACLLLACLAMVLSTCGGGGGGDGGGGGAPPATLSGLSINGPSSVSEYSTGTYTATASWSDNSTSTVTPCLECQFPSGINQHQRGAFLSDDRQRPSGDGFSDLFLRRDHQGGHNGCDLHQHYLHPLHRCDDVGEGLLQRIPPEGERRILPSSISTPISLSGRITHPLGT